MESKKVSYHLIGGTALKDIYADNGELIVKKNTLLTKKNIDRLMLHNIQKIHASSVHIEDALLFQIESFIKRSEQPLFWEEYIQMIEDTKRYYVLLMNRVFDSSPDYLLVKLNELVKLLSNKKEFIKFAYSIKGNEDSLYRHAVNVAILAHFFSELTVTIKKPFLLMYMGYFHDIGKTMINQKILFKPTPLTKEEKKHIQKHTYYGPQILKRIGITRKEILDAAFLHHETRKGDGYPNKIDKTQIPLEVQIISVADVFDTLCSYRVYKTNSTIFEAINKLYFDSVQDVLNPMVVFPFIEFLLKLFQNEKEKVKLSNNAKGYIYYLNPNDIIRPIIHLEDESFLDLSQEKDVFIIDFAFKE